MRAVWVLVLVLGCDPRPLPPRDGAGDEPARDGGAGTCAPCDLGRPAVLYHCPSVRACGRPAAECFEGTAQVAGCVFADGVQSWACVARCPD